MTTQTPRDPKSTHAAFSRANHLPQLEDGRILDAHAAVLEKLGCPIPYLADAERKRILRALSVRFPVAQEPNEAVQAAEKFMADFCAPYPPVPDRRAEAIAAMCGSEGVKADAQAIAERAESDRVDAVYATDEFHHRKDIYKTSDGTYRWLPSLLDGKPGWKRVDAKEGQG